MTLFDRVVELYITVILIIGGYQPYFWAQRQTWFPAKRLETRFDSWITYDPRWVWIYSGLYYPMILLAALSVSSWHDFAYTAGNFLFLLLFQVTFFLFLPVEIPVEWRTKNRPSWEGTASQRFLDVVWSFDKLRNSMPSMHVSMATLVDLTIWKEWPTIGHIGILFPILIGASALKTKQHYVVDVVPGAAVGVAMFYIWNAWVL